MSDKEQFEKLDKSLEDIAKKLKIDIDWTRDLSKHDIIWLLDHCPFLQMVNPDIQVDFENSEVKIVTAKSSGWDIHVYPDAMTSSPGRFLFGGGYFQIHGEDDEGGGGGQIVNPGKGTLYNQAIMTAMEMVTIAKKLGWKTIQIVDGHPRMMRGAWLKAQELGIELQGYEPTNEDYRVQERVQMSQQEMETLYAEVKKSSR